MKIQRLLRSKKGSVLIWVLVALLVIALLTTLVLQISSRYFNSTTERHIDSQAYHSAYSLTYSIATWISSYDADKAAEGVTAEVEKKNFLDALQAVGSEPIFVDAVDPYFDIPGELGECKATITYTKKEEDSSGIIHISSTAKYEGRTNTVTATLEGAFANTDMTKNTKFDSSFSPAKYGLQTNVVTEITDAVDEWPALANKPAYMGRHGGDSSWWRYFSLTKETYNPPTGTGASKVIPPSFISVNPRFGGGRGANVTTDAPVLPTNRFIYYSHPSGSGSSYDFVEKDPLPSTISSNDLDVRVFFNPYMDMLNPDYFIPRNRPTATPYAIGEPDFFAGQNPVTRWPLNASFDSTATLIELTGVSPGYAVPGTRFTYFTDLNFYDPAMDTDYILARYLGGGNSFSGLPTPWTAYKHLYLYMLNESNRYMQISGAVSSQGGAIFTKRDTLVGGTFTENRVITTDPGSFNWLATYPTMLNNMQLYFAKPADLSVASNQTKYPGLEQEKESKIQGTPDRSGNILHKTRINGGWIVVQDNHSLEITNSFVNTQKAGTAAKIDMTSSDATSRIRGAGHISYLKDGVYSETSLYIGPRATTPAPPAPTQTDTNQINGIVTGLQSGNDIYVAEGGQLTIGEGALICSDIYVDAGATLILDSNATIYGNIYANGLVEIKSKDVRVYGRDDGENMLPDETIVNGSPEEIGKQASGIYVYANKTANTLGNIIITANITEAEAAIIFDTAHNEAKELVNGIHTFVTPTTTGNPATAGDSDFTAADVSRTIKLINALEGRAEDASPLCTHFQPASLDSNWMITHMDGD